MAVFRKCRVTKGAYKNRVFFDPHRIPVTQTMLVPLVLMKLGRQHYRASIDHLDRPKLLSNHYLCPDKILVHHLHRRRTARFLARLSNLKQHFNNIVPERHLY